MAFAPVLNDCCSMLGCSNKELAARCGISMSALSRYRNGKRAPRDEASVVERLAEGISALASERGIESASNKAEVKRALNDALMSVKPLGPSFSERVDALMTLLGMRNATVAAALGLDSSYVSRIRRGERNPNDKKRFAQVLSQTAAIHCMERNKLSEVLRLMEVIDSPEEWDRLDADAVRVLGEVISHWLLGDQVVESDIAAVDDLLEKLNALNYDEVLSLPPAEDRVLSCPVATEPAARFFRGGDFMWEAEITFLQSAAQCGASHLYFSSDVPGIETEITPERKALYQKALLELIARGCEITIIHSIDRPLRDSLSIMDMWIPLYMTGKVRPLYLSDGMNHLFCHVNNVCECCALASEAVRGHEADGQYYMTSLPEDVEYYRKKMDFMLEKALVLLEFYRGDDEEDMRLFEEGEQRRKSEFEWREVRAEKYENLKVISYANDCVVVHIGGRVDFKFVVRHPKLRYVFSRMS